jgi:hypothetical protein
MRSQRPRDVSQLKKGGIHAIGCRGRSLPDHTATETPPAPGTPSPDRADFVGDIMRRNIVLLLALMFCLSQATDAQERITKLEMKTVPADRRIRPWENAVIQVVIYADVTDENGNKKNQPIKRNGSSFRIRDKDAGWLSKPFRYQGIEGVSSLVPDRFKLEELLGTAEDFVWQDSVLYTAPAKSGKYAIEVTLEGKSAKIEIEVSSKAPSYRKSERMTFQPETNRDPYLSLATHYAPWIAQETWFTPKADYLARFDYDGDWNGDNNWDSLDTGSSQAFVYYAAMETETHWFLIYNFYHPRDYSDKCVAGTCHENDNEGVILTIAKDGSPNGHLQVMETLAHNNLYSFRADRRVQDGVHDIDGDIEWVGTHPVVFIESGGHGVFASTTHHARFSLQNQFAAGTGVTFVYKGKPERPRYTNDREVGYDLLPIYEQWWKKADPALNWHEKTFDDFFTYQPLGDRPGAVFPTIPGSFWGRKEASNKAKPFWGWHDNLTLKKKVLAVGQWGLDPAYAVSRDLHFPNGERFSLNYVYNPYLNLGSNIPGRVTSNPQQQVAPGTSSDTSSPSNTGQAANSNSASPTQAGGLTLPELPSYRSRNYNASSKEGSLDLRLYVDGEIELLVQADRIQYRVKSGKLPREDGSEFTQPIPKTKLKYFKVDKKDGRGDVQLLEPPAPENDYTARIRIDDPKRSEDHYRIEVKWKR